MRHRQERTDQLLRTGEGSAGNWLRRQGGREAADHHEGGEQDREWSDQLRRIQSCARQVSEIDVYSHVCQRRMA
ncbi:hypothetical protein LSAT2_016087, partial [Lamellibrachia satsuma]